MIDIVTAQTQADYTRVAALADRIWQEHYTRIIGAKQVRYMVDRFQSEDAIAQQCKDDGIHYYIAALDGVDAGYGAVRLDADDSLFLSKLYVDHAARGQGIAKRLMERFLSDFPAAKEVYLAVNKNNEGSIAAYKRLGFAIVREMCTDIGNGFVMDDYEMRQVLKPNSI